MELCAVCQVVNLFVTPFKCTLQYTISHLQLSPPPSHYCTYLQGWWFISFLTLSKLADWMVKDHSPCEYLKDGSSR